VQPKMPVWVAGFGRPVPKEKQTSSNAIRVAGR
jgi:hypothetical protein